MRAAIVLGCALWCAVPPSFAEPDAAALGAAHQYPLGNAATWFREPYRVGSWSALHRVPGIETRKVAASGAALPLPRDEAPAPRTWFITRTGK